MAQSHRETQGRQGKCQWFITSPAVLHAEADNPECSFPTGKQIQFTWMHPRSHHWHLIDYVLTRQRNLRSVWHIRAVRGSEAWSDHRFVKCTVHCIHVSQESQATTRPVGGQEARRLQTTGCNHASLHSVKFWQIVLQTNGPYSRKLCLRQLPR